MMIIYIIQQMEPQVPEFQVVEPLVAMAPGSIYWSLCASLLYKLRRTASWKPSVGAHINIRILHSGSAAQHKRGIAEVMPCRILLFRLDYTMLSTIQQYILP